MSIETPQFSKETSLVLRNADKHIRAQSGRSHHHIYQFLRITMAKITRVDAFYIGFFRDEKRIVFPYNFDGQEYDVPEQLHYSEQGMCAWILKNKKPYFYQHDAGALLKYGQNFGDVSRVSADAVVIPVFESSDSETRIAGMASIQSYEAGVYNRETAQAFQWLTKSVMTVILRNREDAVYRRELGFDERVEFHKDPVAAIVENIGFKLEDLRDQAREIGRVAREGDLALLDATLGQFSDSCEQIQTDTLESLMESPAPDEAGLFNELTVRQQQVALLLAKGYSDKQIATRLKIKPGTVKSHVNHVLRKFDVRQRIGVAVILNGSPKL